MIELTNKSIDRVDLDIIKTFLSSCGSAHA